jgi:hypothetical protein
MMHLRGGRAGEQFIRDLAVAQSTQRAAAPHQPGGRRRARAPHSRIFVVSQWGSPATYWKALRPAQRQQFVAGDQGGGGTGPCAFIDPRGRLVPREAARLNTIIHGYEAQLAAGCQRIPRCTYDRGAFGRQVDKNEQISEDLNHFSVQGAAAAAAVAWAAMKQRGVIPQ